MSDNPQTTVTADTLRTPNATGPGTGLRGMGAMVADASKHLAKAPAFMVFACACLGALVFAASRNHEPIAMAVGIVATAVFGSGAAKNYIDQKFTNGSGAPK